MYEVVAIMYGDRSYAFKSHPYYIDSSSFIIKEKFPSHVHISYVYYTDMK